MLNDSKNSKSLTIVRKNPVLYLISFIFAQIIQTVVFYDYTEIILILNVVMFITR